MKKLLISLITSLIIAIPAINAQDFFGNNNQVEDPMGLPNRLFVLGIRTGVNLSNLSDDYSASISDMRYVRNQWKAGFSLGAVLDINIRNFLTLQPGIFFQTRNHDYSQTLVSDDASSFTSIEGHRNSSYFQFPILASIRRQFTPDFQVQVDFGPYFMYGIGGSDEYKYFSADFTAADKKIESYYRENDYFGHDGMVKGYDWGFKFGAGAVFMNHYYLGIHYEAGCRNVLKKDPVTHKEYTGHNKAWNFTIGYNF